MSGIGWVDFSSTDRGRVQEVLALLKEQGTLDELGVGQVRDAFSDRMFPGFSTIQTTARYFLAVPHIMREWAALPAHKRLKQPLATYLAAAEYELAARLVANHGRLGLPLEGIIGHTLVEKGGVARRPSSTYWNGLRVFNIVRSDQSLAEFCREWLRDGRDSDAVDSEEGTDDGDVRFEAEVRLAPGARAASPDELTLRLTSAEARFLSMQFQMANGHGESIAAQLLSTQLTEPALRDTHRRFAAFSVWANHQQALSRACRDCIDNAQRFSLAIEGAHIIFNELLAERLENDVLRARCKREYAEWQERIAQAQVFHDSALQQWFAPTSSGKVSFKALTVGFLDDWNRAQCRRASRRDLNALVEAQAVRNKPGRSLLVRLPRKAADWYGMKELDYRWPTARRMLADVAEAL
jgi:hypothetical protein